jgi:hypothetical protein
MLVNVLAWVARSDFIVECSSQHHRNSQITNFGCEPTPRLMNRTVPET